jgi:Rv2632c-like
MGASQVLSWSGVRVHDGGESHPRAVVGLSRDAKTWSGRQREDVVTTTKTWRVDLFLYEDGDHTKADAVLHTDAGTELRASGVARKNPADRQVPEIGDELATCRALSELSHLLLVAASNDVEENIGAPARLMQ